MDNKLLIPVDFEDLDDWLKSVGSDFSPAELHGALVGALAGSMRLSVRDWSSFALAVMGADERLIGDDASRQMLGELVLEQLELLAGEDLRFIPFLPEDATEIGSRVAEMSLWCKGFLGGFAEAQVFRGRGEPGELEADLDELPPTVTEALQDMTAIAHAALEESDFELFDEEDEFFEDEEQLAEGERADDTAEYNERDYFELFEYLRLAALTVFTEYGWVEARDAPQTRRVKDALKSAINLEHSTNRTLH